MLISVCVCACVFDFFLCPGNKIITNNLLTNGRIGTFYSWSLEESQNPKNEIVVLRNRRGNKEDVEITNLQLQLGLLQKQTQCERNARPQIAAQQPFVCWTWERFPTWTGLLAVAIVLHAEEVCVGWNAPNNL